MRSFIMFYYLLPTLLFSQKVEFHTYVVEEKHRIDSITDFYAGKEFEFTSRRVYSDDSIFKENKLFNHEYQEFKIKNGCWYIKNKHKWNLFYSPVKKTDVVVRWGGHDFKLIQKDTLDVCGIPSIGYELVSMDFLYDGIYRIWFNPGKGIVRIVTDDVVLVRIDVDCK